MSFDIGQAFVNLLDYLPVVDKLNLGSTCRLLRQVVFHRGHGWQYFSITDGFIREDHKNQEWQKYVSWVHTHIDFIKPSVLCISVTQEDHCKDQKFINLFLLPLCYVQQLIIRTNSIDVHLLMAHACPNINKIVFQSNQINDELAEYILKHLTRISHLQVDAAALEFTCSNISKYLTNPLQSLILKPYQLNYEAILQLVRDEELNHLKQLQIDVEQCSSDTLIAIMSHLHSLCKLRLFHLQNMYDSQSLFASLSQQITELTLTKCYNLSMANVISQICSHRLEVLDLTEARCLRDDQLLMLAQKSMNLKELNISWCNSISDEGVNAVIKSCLSIEKLILTGLKSLSDAAFEEYAQLKEKFNEKTYDEVRYRIKKAVRERKTKSLAQVYSEFQSQVDNRELFSYPVQCLNRKTLCKLRQLDCNNCNSISDRLLKLISSLNGKCAVINYYGQNLSLFREDVDDQDLQ